MSKAILSVVKVIAKRECLDFDDVKLRWTYSDPIKVEPYFIKSGGGRTKNLQEAQIFGWSKSAKKTIDQYRADPELYEVIPVRILTEGYCRESVDV